MQSSVTSPRSVEEGGTPRTPRGSTQSPGSRGKLVKRKVRRRKKGGTMRKSRSSSVAVAEGAPKSGERSSSSAENPGIAEQPEAVPVSAKDVSKHTAFVCPSCSRELESNIELTRHLESHQDSPFPGIPVRHRNSILAVNAVTNSSRPTPATALKNGSATMAMAKAAAPLSSSSQLVPIKLPPVSVYMSGDYFNWR